MKLKAIKAAISRRRFLTITSIAATAGLVPKQILAAKKMNETTGFKSALTADEPVLMPVNTIAEIIESKTICIEPGVYLGDGTTYELNTNGHLVPVKKVLEPNRYLGWPTIAKTRQGRLLVSFSGDRDSHICPYGKTQLITSDDDGKTWSEPETINNTPLDDRDAGLIQTKKGTLVVSWFTSMVFEGKKTAMKNHPPLYNKYARIGEKIPAETKKQWLGNWVRRSEDMGKTWLEPVRTVGTAPHGPINLKNGDLLYVSTGLWENQPAIITERSTDDGKSWKVIGRLPNQNYPISTLAEPHVVELSSSKLIAMIRNEPKDVSQKFLLQSESTDGGKTWSDMKSTGIWGYPPHLMQLKNGWLLVVYGCRKVPYGERACISKDEGKTWDTDNEINLSNAASRDLGYPSSVQLNDGSILTVFYQAPKLGEPACIMSTHWKLA
jgi:sialidase-1